MPLPPGSFQFNPSSVRLFKRPFGNGAGYGLELPEAEQQKIADWRAANPLSSLQECLEAFRDVLGSVMPTADLAPWQGFPFRGRRRTSPLFRVVLNVPAAIDAAANAAGLALAAANSTITPAGIATPTAANEALRFFSVPAPLNYVVRLQSWGISVQNAPPESAAMGVLGETVGGLPEPPIPGICSHQIEQHQPADALVLPGGEVAFTVRNLTVPTPAVRTPLLLFFSATWWEFPVSLWTDSREGSGLNGGIRSGYGVECRR